MSDGSGSLSGAIVVISDLVEPHARLPMAAPAPTSVERYAGSVEVRGGYLERLPLAAVRVGLADLAEIWHHHRQDAGIATVQGHDGITRRSFPVDRAAPFHSDAMVAFVRRHGAPRVLCVWGLGVSEALLEVCADSVIIYNSIDVPALRVPPEVSRHFDLVLTGAQWQSEAVSERHPAMPTHILPIGPDFASPETFFPVADAEKRYDVVYVAAAQAYKRHDILFDALARSPIQLRALCVMGYGDDGERLRQDAAQRSLAVDFVGPPGVSHAEVNRLINQAKIGVVCGVDDGAPAILTEYMLAGLPVVANAELRCGLQYILPETGIAASADRFELGILEALHRTDFRPRQTVLDRWAWPHSISKLAALIASLEADRADRRAIPEFA